MIDTFRSDPLLWWRLILVVSTLQCLVVAWFAVASHSKVVCLENKLEQQTKNPNCVDLTTPELLGASFVTKTETDEHNLCWSYKGSGVVATETEKQPDGPRINANNGTTMFGQYTQLRTSGFSNHHQSSSVFRPATHTVPFWSCCDSHRACSSWHRCICITSVFWLTVSFTFLYVRRFAA